MKMTKAIVMGLGLLATALGQDATPQRATIPFSDATAPRKLIVDGPRPRGRDEREQGANQRPDLTRANRFCLPADVGYSTRTRERTA